MMMMNLRISSNESEALINFYLLFFCSLGKSPKTMFFNPKESLCTDQTLRLLPKKERGSVDYGCVLFCFQASARRRRRKLTATRRWRRSSSVAGKTWTSLTSCGRFSWVRSYLSLFLLVFLFSVIVTLLFFPLLVLFFFVFLLFFFPWVELKVDGSNECLLSFSSCSSFFCSLLFFTFIWSSSFESCSFLYLCDGYELWFVYGLVFVMVTFSCNYLCRFCVFSSLSCICKLVSFCIQARHLETSRIGSGVFFICF